MSKDDIHTKRKGDIAEQNAITKLLEIGVDEVYTPVGENTRADLVYRMNNKLVPVQIKHGRYENGCVVFNCAGTHFNTTSCGRTTYEGDVDEFMVYSPKTEQIYIIPMDEIGDNEMRLRFETNDNPHSSYHNSNWAEDYELRSTDDLVGSDS